jgi:hypothetical protein
MGQMFNGDFVIPSLCLALIAEHDQYNLLPFQYVYKHKQVVSRSSPSVQVINFIGGHIFKQNKHNVMTKKKGSEI